MKRSRHTIISQILDICLTGAGKTEIVYKANLNFRTVNPYLDLLIKNELLEVENGRNAVYKTTSKGMDLLNTIQEIDSQLTER